MLNQVRRFCLKGLSKKLLVAAAVVTALGVTSGRATAAPFNPFSINPQVLTVLNPVNGGGPGPYGASVTGLGKFDGQYTETLTILTLPTILLPGTFSTTAEMLFTGLDTALLGTPVAGTTTGLGQGNGYEIYALFNATGTFTTVGTVTTFSSGPGSGSATLYVDPLNPATSFATAPPARDAGTFGDDQILANAVLTFGQGSIDTASAACLARTQCGSFGLTFADTLTPLGLRYFTAPVPFYLQALLNGVFDPFPLSGTSFLTGSGNLFFASPVPEPATLTLLGIGLVGLARRHRRRNVIA